MFIQESRNFIPVSTPLYVILRGASLLTSAVCIIVILHYAKLLNDQLNEQSVRLALQQAELENKNTQIMVSQIQPHFLYNTLSVIDYLCGKDVEAARNTINAFSDYLRMNMESINSSKPVPFEKELEHTKTYLGIEKLRFSDILNIEYDIQETDFVIPPLTLQPLCENAVKHGVRGREEGGTVRISTRRNGNTIFIHVEDDGIGFDTNKDFDDNRIHVGIQNVQNRLQMISGGRLDITSRPGIGTIATIVLNLQ